MVLADLAGTSRGMVHELADREGQGKDQRQSAPLVEWFAHVWRLALDCVLSGCLDGGIWNRRAAASVFLTPADRGCCGRRNKVMFAVIEIAGGVSADGGRMAWGGVLEAAGSASG